jgi:hypothetical protein
LGGRDARGILILGAEVADDALGFLGGALGIEGDEACEDLLVGQISAISPAVGLGDGGIEVVVELAEDRDESLIVDHLFLGCEGASSISLAQCLEHVVDPGESERGMNSLHALPMGIEFLGEGADAGLL